MLLINTDEQHFDFGMLPTKDRSIVNVIHYDLETFLRLYEIGSLFILHALMEGVILSGDQLEWSHLRKNFEVQKDFREELADISRATSLLAETKTFGGKYMTPLVNSFTELKNACIFFLAHHGVYEFNKARCFDLAFGLIGREVQFKELKAFYDYSIRCMEVPLPFEPSDEAISSSRLIDANIVVLEMCNACR